MLPFLKHRLHRLGSQLTFIFLVGFLGISVAIGLPVILLISQQASSHAQLLLDQAVVASRAFMEQEKADLQSLALLISQRPTLIGILNGQDFSLLEDYLNTLQEGANIDFILICSQENELPGIGNLTKLCPLDSQSGYAAPSPGETWYLYATAEVSAVQPSRYKVIVGKRASSIIQELQMETGLLYFLLQQEQMADVSDPSVEVRPTLAAELLQRSNDNTNGSLQQRSFRINEHRYILSNQKIDPALGLNLISALNVDDQITVQQSLSSSLLFGLFFILLIASSLGIWLSQRISRPIVRLANAAAEFRQGNLDAPISIQSPVWEIDQLTNTLEDGRVALRHSLQQLQAEKARNCG